MIIATLILLLCTFVFAPFTMWQGGLLLPLACVVVGSAFGAWRFVLLWVAVFLILALTTSLPWIEFIILLAAAGFSAWAVTRFLHQEQGATMIVTLGIVFLIAVWVQTALITRAVYHPSIIGSFVLTFPFIFGMVLWFTYPKRRLL